METESENTIDSRTLKLAETTRRLLGEDIVIVDSFTGLTIPSPSLQPEVSETE